MTTTTIDGRARLPAASPSPTPSPRRVMDRLLVARHRRPRRWAPWASPWAPCGWPSRTSSARCSSQFPEEILAIAGGADMATASGWYTGEMYSIVVPFAVMFVAAASAARAFGGEVENETMGLVMSTPTRRTRLAIDKAVAMVLHVFIAAGLIGLMTWIGIVRQRHRHQRCSTSSAITPHAVAAVGLRRRYRDGHLDRRRPRHAGHPGGHARGAS